MQNLFQTTEDMQSFFCPLVAAWELHIVYRETTKEIQKD